MACRLTALWAVKLSRAVGLLSGPTVTIRGHKVCERTVAQLDMVLDSIWRIRSVTPHAGSSSKVFAGPSSKP